MHNGYFGSVRFFKNLVLLAVLVGIAVPTALAIRYHSGLVQSQAESARLAKDAAQAQELQQELQQAEDHSGYINGEAPAYQALYPDFYAPEKLTADRHTDKTVFLTFDDGPSDRTPEILDILKAQDVKATFFVIGRTDDVAKERMRRIVEEGHTLGMHSYSHDYKKIYASVEAYLDDLYRLFLLIQETTGVTPSVFRFPGGSINAYNYGVYQEIMSEMLRRGFVPCDWNLSSGDATGAKISSAEIVNNVVQSAANVTRGFVLMHDAAPKTATVGALNDMIGGLRSQGFTFEALTPDVKPILFGYSE